MLERNDNKPATVEQLGQELLNFVRNTEFGASQYQAVRDYFDLQSLYDDLRIDRINLIESKDASDKIAVESQMRVTELRIALLNNEIRHNQSRLEGYSNAYTHISVGFDDLLTVAYIEADNKFPNDSMQRSTYVDKVYDDIFAQAHDAVFVRRSV